MSFWDSLGSLADKLHIRSEGYAPREPQQYQPQQQDPYAQDPYAQQPYDDRQVYEPAPPMGGQQQADDYQYQTNYGTGSGYTSAGARPMRGDARKPKNSVLSGITDLFRPKAQQQQQYAPQQVPDNVVPFAQQAYADDQAYSGARSAYIPPPQQQYEPQRGQQQAPASSRGRTEAAQAAPVPRAQTSTMIYLVRRLEDTEEIIAFMLDGGNVIVNMEEIDEVLKQRVLDMVSGAAFAMDCLVKRISYRNYFIAPSGEEIVSNISTRDREPPPEDNSYGYRSRRYDR